MMNHDPQALPAHAPAVLSPALQGAHGPAFELKFHVSNTDAATIEQWARQILAPDVHGLDGRYSIRTLYCDTPALDVYHRSPGYRRSKFRLRRYGASEAVFLERK